MNHIAKVSVKKTVPVHDRVMEDVRMVMEIADWKQYISRNAPVSLKVNLGWDKLIPGAISAPWVVEGVIRTLKDYAGHVYLVESDQVVVDVEKVFRLSGLDRVCRDYGVEWVNMSKGRFVRMQDERRLVLKDISIPEILTKTEVITLPLMKMHNKSVITGAIKNQWGCLPTLRHNFHLVLSEALVDINAIVRPRFAVMDGTIGLEGNGPKSGIPKEMGLILASGDLVAIDSVAAYLMGCDPATINHLQLCSKHGLGCCDLSNITVVGANIEALRTPFRHAQHNIVSWGELLLRRSALRWLVFQTPLFHLFCWLTRRYYDYWDFMVGRHLRQRIFDSSGYAQQWQEK